MADILASVGAAPEPTYGSNAPAATQPLPPAPAQPQAAEPNPADLRLVIEDDQAAGCFVYKTVDWRTGEVVQQLPREQVVKMREATNYIAGDVIKSQA